MPLLTDHHIHIYQQRLIATPEKIDYYFQLLSVDEQQRAQRFKFDKHQNRFIIGRGILRELLADYLTMVPEAIRFCHNDYGKPAILASQNPQNVQFNISHSSDQAIYAIRQHHTVRH